MVVLEPHWTCKFFSSKRAQLRSADGMQAMGAS